MQSVRVAFVMEQTLGHVTHARNLRRVLARQQRVSATWLPIPFDVGGATRLVPVLRSNWSVRASWRTRRALQQALGRVHHDALFFHSQVTSLFSIDLMRNYPAVVSLDATPINYDTMASYYGHTAAQGGFIDRQKYALNRRAFHAAAGLVSWSEWAKASLATDYGVDPGKVRVIAPGAAPEYFHIGARRRYRTEADAEQPVKILFVGGDFQRKGGGYLLQALPDNCELHVVTRDAIDPRPNVHVHHGLGPNSVELRKLFEDADLFVLPSLGECLALVLMEATAAGLPVITTQVGALGEAVLPGESGLVVPAGQAAPLRHAIETLSAATGTRERMGRAGAALAQRKFDAQRNNDAVLDLVCELAATWTATDRAA